MRPKSFNTTTQKKVVALTYNDDAEELDVDIRELNDFEEITFENNQIMTAFIDPEENITFTQDMSNMSTESAENFSIVATDNMIGGDDITFSEGSNSCTFKIEYPLSDSSMNCSGKSFFRTFISDCDGFNFKFRLTSQ